MVSSGRPAQQQASARTPSSDRRSRRARPSPCASAIVNGCTSMSSSSSGLCGESGAGATQIRSRGRRSSPRRSSRATERGCARRSRRAGARPISSSHSRAAACVGRLAGSMLPAGSSHSIAFDAVPVLPDQHDAAIVLRSGIRTTRRRDAGRSRPRARVPFGKRARSRLRPRRRGPCRRSDIVCAPYSSAS